MRFAAPNASQWGITVTPPVKDEGVLYRPLGLTTPNWRSLYGAVFLAQILRSWVRCRRLAPSTRRRARQGVDVRD